MKSKHLDAGLCKDDILRVRFQVAWLVDGNRSLLWFDGHSESSKGKG